MCFHTTFEKIEKILFYSLKFLTTFSSFSHRQLLQKFAPFFQNLLPFLCIFLFLSLFLLYSCFLFLNKKLKNSSLIIGGTKRGSPILIYGGRVPGLPPQSLRLCFM